jgi:hypothetical protein
MSATLHSLKAQEASGSQAMSRLTAAARTRTPARRAWLALVGLTLMFGIALLWRPADAPEWVLCPFRALTGHPCPGCGMTRAFCALAHLEFWRAVKFNALSPVLFLCALGAWVWSVAVVLRLDRLTLFLARLPRPTPSVTRLMLALVMAWWAARLYGGF